MSKNVLALKHLEQPPEPGVWWRLVCLTGQTKGEAYIIKGNRVVMGRSEKADIRVMDIKSSREHAELTRVGNDWTLSDLGSQNGLVLNDQKITQSKIKEGDKIVIGQTVYKFGRVEVKTKGSPKKEEAPVAPPESGGRKTSALLTLVIVVALGVIFLSDDPPPPPKTRLADSSKSKDVSDEYLRLIQQRKLNEDKTQKLKLNTIFQRGLREYREKNYFRAINEFNLALILNPNDPLADFYLRKTKEELDRVIADHFIKGTRDEEGLHYQSAMVSYCSVIRLLHDYETDARYKTAEENIKNLEGKMGLEPGESNCTKKQPASQ